MADPAQLFLAQDRQRSDVQAMRQPAKPDLGGELHLLPQYDALGSTRPLGPGEFVMNKNGSWSNEYSVTVEDPRQPGRYMVVPSLWLVNKKPTLLSEDQAAETAAKSGLNFPMFENEKAAEAFATQREGVWQKTPVGRSDMQSPLWSHPPGTPGAAISPQSSGAAPIQAQPAAAFGRGGIVETLMGQPIGGRSRSVGDTGMVRVPPATPDPMEQTRMNPWSPLGSNEAGMASNDRRAQKAL